MAIAAPVTTGAMNGPRLRTQSPVVAAGGPAFEVASIKPNKSGELLVSGGLFGPNGRFNARNASVRRLVRDAYGLQDFQLIGGPDWTRSERFDIAAKAAGNTSRNTIALMMQQLLTERFKLSVHWETRDSAVYFLILANKDGRLGRALHPSNATCKAVTDTKGGARSTPSADCGLGGGFGALRGSGATMDMLASALGRDVSRAVINRTELKGNYDLELNWTPDQIPPGPFGPLPPGAPPMPTADANGPSIFTAITEQLGLKLQPGRGPVKVLVIDHVERPTAN
jgi:uncharacterized protein (TIGR03435 family)